MKKYLLTLSALFILFTGFNQNWSLVMPNDTLVYQKEGSSKLLSTVWVDSIQNTGVDTTYFMNRISPGKVIDTIPLDSSCAFNIPGTWGAVEVLVRELTKPQFCGNSFAKSGIKWHVGAGIKNYTIYPLANVGDSWVCDSVSGDSMKLMSSEFKILDVYLISDSIKTFEFKGKTLVLSKSHGILNQFNLLMEDSEYYDLVGIQNQRLGLIIPMGKDYFDYNIGDLFVRWIGWADSDGPVFDIHKNRVTAKNVVGDTLIYGYGNREVKYWSTMNPVLNAFPNTLAELIPIFYDTSGVGISKGAYVPVEVKRWGQNETIKETPYYSPGYCQMDSVWIEFQGMLPHGAYRLGMEPYREGVDFGLGSSFNDLVGYITDGIPHGDTTSVTEIETEKLFNVFPIPASSKIQITTEKYGEVLSYEVTNLQGALVKMGRFQSEVEWQVNEWPKGVYFVIIRNNNGAVLLRKKVMVL